MKRVDTRYNTCPLCQVSDEMNDVCGADDRRYHLCRNCSLIFVDSCHLMSREEEKARYMQHENSIDDNGYVRFLHRVVDPMLPYLDARMRGLDYGCGPGPTLSRIVKSYGIECDDYDPLFICHNVNPPYDFIFATECFEHFHTPYTDIGQLKMLLQPSGILGIMTQRWTTVTSFSSWHYTNDRTHVSFFHEKTFDFICKKFGFECLWKNEKDVIILRHVERSAV